ncbi:MAG TPA: O-antigen ligase family protein [Verrucomicrobiae bacterium]|nr:O-antigen ligase family protein [Verrucomicrobiae bacterium]
MKAGTKPKSAGIPAKAPAAETASSVFAALFGLVLSIGILKFGNPVIFEHANEPPADLVEWIINGWPVAWSYWLLGAVAILGVCVARWKTHVPHWVAALPLIWLGWQLAAASRTVDPRLTFNSLREFTACVVCFYLGLFSLGRAKRTGFFWAGLATGFVLVLFSGFLQHFGGLEQTRRYFFLYMYPRLRETHPEYLAEGYLKKMSSDRIFATLFYPNTLAGVILLLLPATLGVIWSLQRQMTAGARTLLASLVGGAGLACLYWSGSKGGWLLMLIVVFVAALFQPFQRKLKLILIVGVLTLGLAGFCWKYSGFFKKGAPSVGARFDYWRAALQTASDHPVFGTGPGTFGIAYKKIKKPESEMALLAHNDYLEQASDSGWPGFMFYSAMLVAALLIPWRRGVLQSSRVNLAVWLGLLGWALQGLVEFGLFIPALAWPAFSLLGWLLGQPANEFTETVRSHKLQANEAPVSQRPKPESSRPAGT